MTNDRAGSGSGTKVRPGPRIEDEDEGRARGRRVPYPPGGVKTCYSATTRVVIDRNGVLRCYKRCYKLLRRCYKTGEVGDRRSEVGQEDGANRRSEIRGRMRKRTDRSVSFGVCKSLGYNVRFFDPPPFRSVLVSFGNNHKAGQVSDFIKCVTSVVARIARRIWTRYRCYTRYKCRRYWAK